MDKSKEILKYSNPEVVFRRARDYGINHIAISTHASKKYMIRTPDNRIVHFGQFGMEDFTKHKNEKRRSAYLARANGIKGDWKLDKYSPNNLSINLLW